MTNILILIIFIVSFILFIISIRRYNKKREELRMNEEEQQEAIIDLEEQVNEDINNITTHRDSDEKDDSNIIYGEITPIIIAAITEHNKESIHIDTSNIGKSDFDKSNITVFPEPNRESHKYIASIDPYAKDTTEGKIMIGKIVNGVFQAKVNEERNTPSSIPEDIREYPKTPNEYLIKEDFNDIANGRDKEEVEEEKRDSQLKEDSLEHGEEDVLKLLLKYLKEDK